MSIQCYDAYGNPLDKLYQWDCNQEINIMGVDDTHIVYPYLHFCNPGSEVAYVVVPTTSGSGSTYTLTAMIPNVLLQRAEPLVVYVCNIDDSVGTDTEEFSTENEARLAVVPRPRPDDYPYEEEERYPMTQFVTREEVEVMIDTAINGAIGGSY